VLDIPAFVIDETRHVHCHNPRARDLFPNIADNQPLFQVSRSPGLLAAIERARELGYAQTGEMADRGSTGRRLLVTVSPLSNAASPNVGGGLRGTGHLLAQFRDLSEQDRLAQLRSDFIANASHELRTPLASLKGFIETLQGPASGDAAARQRFLGIMERQAARMARILDDLLSLSRIEMRAHLPPKDEVDVAAIVRAALHGLEPIASEAKIRLSLVTADESCIVRGDRDELEQVFQNLIQNAIKYGNDGGAVDVSVRNTPAPDGMSGKITIAIADNGPGIADEHLPRLTERFYRVDTAASRERGGTGLGLAIVKHILNRHQGQLDIVSELGKGSTFTVILNAMPAPQAQ
jgi:two-component system phosphate regulon sensor histidine kinase PhoR